MQVLNGNTYFINRLADQQMLAKQTAVISSTLGGISEVEAKHKIIGLEDAIAEYGHIMGIDTSRKDGVNTALNAIADGLKNNEYIRGVIGRRYQSHLRHTDMTFSRRYDLPGAFEELAKIAKDTVEKKIWS